jgi:hypothetical protein
VLFPLKKKCKKKEGEKKEKCRIVKGSFDNGYLNGYFNNFDNKFSNKYKKIL